MSAKTAKSKSAKRTPQPFEKVNVREVNTASAKFDKYLEETIGTEAKKLFNAYIVLNALVGCELNDNGQRWVKQARNRFAKLQEA